MKTFNDISEQLLYFGVVSKFDLRMIAFLDSLARRQGQEDGLSEEQKLIYVLYFSFLRDGSTRMPLTLTLQERWNAKWAKLKGARMVQQEDGGYALNESDTALASAIDEYFTAIASAAETVRAGVNEPMALDGDYLYTQKSLEAARKITASFGRIFAQSPAEPSDSDIDAIISKHSAGSGIVLDKLQAKAICLGLQGSIIITGGPGTGKTTVVKYLLDELKAMETFCGHKVYLAAPSGKAADRLRESIQGTASALPDGCDSMTIHRLLSYNPGSNDFTYNAGNQFDESSVFVIDEASMIDLELFARLLDAIPAAARVYLLGDKDQLPSVDAGAVLGDIIATAPASIIVELEKSQRFGGNTAVGRLALAMQKNQCAAIAAEVADDKWQSYDSLRSAIADFPSDTNLQLFNYPLQEGKRLTNAQKQENLEKALRPWIDKFCKVKEKNADSILALSKTARILCAEHRGVFGVDNINTTISRLVCGSKTDESFCGKRVMIVKNIESLKLYNGDSGILALNDKKELCFMKDATDLTPLRLIPSECIETSYASTIHKAQGSGYENILMFLPENKQSLLATRQIVYTGVTRLKKGVLTIVGSKDRFDACYANNIVRDTGIDISR